MIRRKRQRVALYLRVSTDGQTTKNQRRDLEAVAKQAGWEIVGVYDDDGVSGAKGREYRKQFDRLLKDAARHQFDMVAAWSVDRLGRSLQHLVAFLQELRALNVGLYLHKQALDTSTPSGRAMFGMLSVFADFERELISERVRAGMARAKVEQAERAAVGKPRIGSDGRLKKAIGRPRVPAATEALIRAARAKGKGKLKISKELGIGVGTVQRVLGAG